MIIKTIRNICLDNVREKDQEDRLEWHENGGDDLDSKWILINDEVKEALSLYYHLKNHTEVQEAPIYKGMPICKICNKSAYQIMLEEWKEDGI